MTDYGTDVTADVVQHATAEEEVRICLFSISGDYYAVTVDILAEIIIPQKIFPVPTTPSHVSGVISLRGNIVPIVDIRPALSLAPATGPGQVAIIRYGSLTLGIAVDSVSEVVSVPKSSILPLPAEAASQDAAAKSRGRYLQAIIRRQNSVAALLNVERLLDAIQLS
ncbi:MAG: chemotaxis protein CheW [Nitrospiraceae bacterium]|nr:chemotaxis protein CheW [Nitrospiraceae bacterium]